MTTLFNRLNFPSSATSNSIEINKWCDVNFYQTLLQYCSNNNINAECYIEPDDSFDCFDQCVLAMEEYGQEDKSTDTYHFCID